MSKSLKAATNLRVETVPIGELRPHPGNPRIHPDTAIDRLAKSIQEFGWTNPVLVSADGFILAGHARVKAAQKAGLKEIPIIRLPLSGKRAEAYMVADNRLPELTSWDMPRLKDLLEKLDTGEMEIELTGFSLPEIEDLMTQFHQPQEGLTPDDEIPEKVEPICKTGDLWQLGNHRLLCGDATKREDIERLMGGAKADMVFTDPPYGINFVKGLRPIDGAKPFGRMRQPGGRIHGVLGGDSGRRLERLTGKVGKPGIVKPRLYYPITGDDKPFDPAFLLGLAPTIILFGANHYASRLPDSAGWLVWDKGIGDEATFSACELLWSNRKGHIRLYSHRWSGMIRAGNRDEELKDRVHPTQKPVGLCQMIISDFEDKTILDPFGGSGSTLIACEKLRRRCFMMEIESFYTSVIIERWTAFTGKEAIREDGTRWSELKAERKTVNKTPNMPRNTISETKSA